MTKSKKSKPHTTNWPQIDRFLESAEKRLSSARKILEFDEEACLQQAYEAMLRASLWPSCSATACGRAASPAITS